MVHLGHHEEEQGAAAEAERLREELAAIKGSPTYQLAGALGEEIDGIVGDEATALQHVGGAVEEAIDRVRGEEIHRRAGPLIKARVAAALAQETDAIDREVEAEADQAAALAVEKFQEDDAESYRQRVRARRTRAAAATAVLGVMRDIDAEEAAGAGVEAADAESAETETRAQLKVRAAAIRKKTHGTGILPYSLLRDEDTITLCFAAEGHGNDPYTHQSAGWGSSYDSSHERRRLRVKLKDGALGAFEVVDDSWWQGTGQNPSAIRGGREILVLSDNPDTDEALEPILVKGAQVTLEALSGKPVGNQRVDLWWVSIGDSKDDFKILS